jgi:hypothetical protein
MILHIENPKDFAKKKKTIRTLNKFSEVAEYKINIQKPVAFLHANSELSTKDIKKIVPLTINTKII